MYQTNRPAWLGKTVEKSLGTSKKVSYQGETHVNHVLTSFL
jgi:hypothetical protein